MVVVVVVVVAVVVVVVVYDTDETVRVIYRASGT